MTIALTVLGGVAFAGGQQAVQPSPFDEAIAAAKSSMMADPGAALEYVHRAAELVVAMPEGSARIIADATTKWLEGEALFRLNRPGEAAPVIDAALANIANDADTKLKGDLMMSRAGIEATNGRIQEALGDFQAAYNIFQAVGARRSQAIALQNIGSIYSDAGDYQRVLEYYDQSAEVYGDDNALNISAHNNRGNAFKELGDYGKAESEFRAALTLALELNSPLLEVRIMTNIASSQLLQGRADEADATAVEALKIANSGTAAGWAPFLWGVRAEVAFAKGALDRAAGDVETAFSGVDLGTTTMPFRDFHKVAEQIYKARGDYRAALEHLEAYKRLDDEAHALTASTNAALMTAEFDSANQKLAISTLKSGQLERDKQIADGDARFQKVVLYGVSGGSALVVALVLIAFFSIRRSRNQTRALNVRLNEANRALEKAVKARTEFLAMTSHEIRTPLNGILGMTQVTLLDDTLSAAQRDNIQLIESAGKTMKLLVDDILDVAKMEAGRLVLEDRTFSLKEMLSEIAAMARGQGEAKGLKVSVESDACRDRWRGDEQRLRQVVYNLMSNAVKFTDEGSISLTAAEVETAAGPRLQIAVTDTGIGIKADGLARIFDSFEQADPSVTRRFGGTGLGLAICKHIVQAMGGAIEVDSEFGWGSTFTVLLPLPATDSVVGTSPKAVPGRVATLLCDPNLLSQSLLAAELEAAGHHVVTSDDATDALAVGASQRFDHVLVAAGALEDDGIEGLGAVLTLRALQPAAHLLVLGAAGAMAPTLLQCGASGLVAPGLLPAEIVQILLGKPAASAALCPTSQAA